MSLTWTVVQFEDNTVEAVPTSWIVGDSSHWPVMPQPKLMNAIRKNEPLNTCWPLHKVKVFRNSTFGDYATARKKTILAEETSDLASEIDDLQGKRKRIHKVLSSSSLSSNDQSPPSTPIKRKRQSYAPTESETLESPPKLPSVTPTTSLKNDSHKESNSNIPVCQNACKFCCGRSKDTKILGDILNQTNIIRVITTDILKGINSRSELSSSEDMTIQTKFPEIKFPITNEEEMELFHNLLGIPENLNLVVNELYKLGGSNNYNFVKRSLSVMISNDLAKKYSYFGRNGKLAFNKHLLSKAIKIAANKAKLALNEVETEKSLKSWLKRSTEREKTTNKKF